MLWELVEKMILNGSNMVAPADILDITIVNVSSFTVRFGLFSGPAADRCGRHLFEFWTKLEAIPHPHLFTVYLLSYNEKAQKNLLYYKQLKMCYLHSEIS